MPEGLGLADNDVRDKIIAVLCVSDGWIVIWAIGSIVFAFVIHWLFSIEPTVEFFRAKWSAGDILTYASTIILGLLALWQNQRFKEENDKSQERLEKISNRTNELQIISQLIEHENERINLLRKLFQEFFEVCSCSNIVAEYRDASKNKADNLSSSTRRASQIRISYQILIQQLFMDKRKNTQVDSLVEYAGKLSTSAIGLILSFTIEQEESHLKNDENGEIKRLTNKQLQIEEALNKEFYIYITALEKERNALLFEDHSLKELQEMYQRREEYGKI